MRRPAAAPFLCLLVVGLAAALWRPPSPRAAEGDLPTPAGKVLLTVTGNIAHGNGHGAAMFDREMLERLGMRTLRTSTVWTEGVKVFEGPLVRDLLAAVGAHGAAIRATALNDYTVTIPSADFEKYRAILALRMDGHDLLVRDKGPLWIVYPRDDTPELQDSRYDSRWVWQLSALQVL